MCPACGISDAASPSFLQRRGRWRSWRCPCRVCLWARRRISLCWMYPEGLLRASVSSFLGWDGSHRVGRKWGKALPTSWGNSMQVSLPMQRLFFFFFSAPPPLTGTTDDQGCISPGAGVGIFAGSSSWKGPPRPLDRRCVPCLGRSCSSWGGSCILSPCQMPPSSPRCP